MINYYFECQMKGGEPAAIGEFPFMVSLRSLVGDTHICGGALIQEDVVVTAAHCVDLSFEDEFAQPLPNVVIGAHKLDDDVNAEVFTNIYFCFLNHFTLRFLAILLMQVYFV